MKRKFLKRIAVIASITMLATSFVGCGKKEAKRTINFINYGENIAEGLLDEFEEKYGIKVNEEKFDEMETMYQKVTSGAVEYDVIVAADYMVERMIAEDRLDKLNKDNIPNLKDIDPEFLNRPYDPKSEYSVSYMSGTIGIVYNKELVKEPVDSWNILWDEKYKNDMFILDSQRDAIGAALKKLGYSLNSTNPKELEEAKNLLIEQGKLVKKYGADEVLDLMRSGEVAVAMIWSGEGLNLSDEDDRFEYVVPKEGANFWIDNLVIPKGSKNKSDAELFINFLCEKDSAFRVAEEIGYTTPHLGAKEEQPDNVKNNPGAYMPKEVMDKCEGYKYLPEEQLKIYVDLWNEVKTSID